MTEFVKRAGGGTSDWNLDRMYETDTARKLEEIYAEDEFPITRIESKFSRAKDLLNQAVRQLCIAATLADRYDKAGPIDDLIDRLDDQFSYDMDKVLNSLKGG